MMIESEDHREGLAAFFEKRSPRFTRDENRNVHGYGNTSAASVPLCIHEAFTEGRIREGDLILIVAFGAGFAWGATLLRW